MPELNQLTPTAFALVILGVFSLAAAVALVLPELRYRLQYREMTQWVPAPATLKFARIKPTTTGTGRTSFPPGWQVEVEYEYQSQGRSFRGNRPAPQALMFTQQKQAEDFVRSLQAASPLVALFNPRDASQSVLRPLQWSLARPVFAGALLIVGIAAVTLVKPFSAVPAPAASVIPTLRCAASKATYRHQANAGFEARFVQARDGEAYLLAVTSPGRRNYWFRLTESNGYGGIHLVPVRSPLLTPPEEPIRDITALSGAQPLSPELAAQLRLYPFDHTLRLLDSPPAPGGPLNEAPAFLLMPELGNLLWYEPGALTGNAATPTEVLPRGLFRLSHCQWRPLL